ncbi:MAG: hypothetical protein DMF96_00835 [Acidobacteria bacterium]|nr:MAG: hypothetical protein DMF96_00835 [Acidobacteriota bacterium]
MPPNTATMRAAKASRFDLRAVAACSAATLLAGVVYLNALHNPFVYDDYHTVVANTSLQRVANIRAIVLHDVTRPIVNLSYAIDHALWGATPPGFHVTNVLLHMLNVVLLYRLARRLAEDRHADLVACAAAMLFAVHPMMTEAVGYISGRSEVLCATWFLAGLLCGRRWVRGDGAACAMLTVGFWVAALATKETAAMFPFVLFACDRLTCSAKGSAERSRERAADNRRRFLTIHLPLMATAVIAGVVRLAVLRFEYPGQVSVHPSYVLIDLDVVRRYVWLLLHPAGQALFHEVAAVRSLWEPRALFAVGSTGLMMATAWRLRRVEPVASFGIVWFLLLLVPAAALNVLDQGEPMAEHRVYLASGGFFLAVGAGIGRLGVWLARARTRTRWLGGAVFALGLLSFSVETVIRNAVWADPVILWRESVDLAPNHPRPRLLLGEALQDAGRREEAVEQYKLAVRLRPTEVTGYLKLGACLTEMGRFDQARQYLLQAIALDPHNVSARRTLGLLEAIGRAK